MDLNYTVLVTVVYPDIEAEFDVYILKVMGIDGKEEIPEERKLRMMSRFIYKTKKECVKKAIKNQKNTIQYNKKEIIEIKKKIKEDKETLAKFKEILKTL